jgi:hypothetical protein
MSRNKLSDSLNAKIDAFTAKHHNRPLHYLTRAFLAREDCTLSVEDVMRVFDEIPQRSNTTPLREQTGRVSGVVSDVREYNAGLIDAFTVNREVTHYTLKNPEQFSNTGFSLIENHLTNRGRFKKYLTRELYDAIAAERLNREMIENEAIVSETVTFAEFESHLPKIVTASEEVSIPETLLITDESTQDSTLSDSSVLEEFALDASDAATRKFKRRDKSVKSVKSDASESVAA